jgi:hypothetical protein
MKKATPRKTKKATSRGASPVPLKTSGVGGKQFGGPPVSRLQAIWLDGKVPAGYWHRLANRRLYVRWLGQTLGFSKPEDWYRISTGDFKRNHGGGILGLHWRSSAIGAVKECFPDYDWKDWLFRITPRRFWKDPRNHRRYMKWLGRQLGIRRPSAWYRVNNHDFEEHKGGAFLLHYRSTVSLAIMSYLPNYDWKEWMFDKTPKGFWNDKRNRRRYMSWLGKRLGVKSIAAWYSVTDQDFRANFGNQFLKLYHGSPIAALRDHFPRQAWNEWMFARVPSGFWDRPANRKRYLRWLGKKLRFKRPGDWHRVRNSDFRANCGGGLVAGDRSHVDLVKECVPGFKPRREAPRRRLAPARKISGRQRVHLR